MSDQEVEAGVERGQSVTDVAVVAGAEGAAQ